MTNDTEYLFYVLFGRRPSFKNIEEEWLSNLGFPVKSEFCLSLYDVSERKREARGIGVILSTERRGAHKYSLEMRGIERLHKVTNKSSETRRAEEKG